MVDLHVGLRVCMSCAVMKVVSYGFSHFNYSSSSAYIYKQHLLSLDDLHSPCSMSQGETVVPTL